MLDLFAGSGQMGLEAVSRGAESVVLVDASRDAIGVITRNAERTRLSSKTEIKRSDALSFLSAARGEPFHLVFLDPPYAAGLLPQCLSLLLSRGLLTAGGIVVAESAEAEDVFGGDESLCERFEVLKAHRYGAAYITVLREKTI